ncbi:histidine phosphatase family protein [Solitalea sp. MAHUQ-68]|uniref:Histidine phosphatase family protein n=1 Tax=Solitalea agri TaxID=2953739 RepID=A0A9X2JF45_9SPHI|nr:phosphoglycerate mutase family protein [Solitalea agri]MCO4294595.1 histidine phosphatase family protein [Solitalea agri]
MVRSLSKITGLLFLCALISTCQNSSTSDPSPDLTTIILVRHAEKLNLDPDSPLSSDGKRRANDLATLLDNVHIDAVYSIAFPRNLSTVQPLCESKGLSPILYQRNVYAGVIETIVNNYKGETVLICGDTETVPGMLNVLSGGEEYKTLKEPDYNHIYYALARQIGKSEVIVKTYGE